MRENGKAGRVDLRGEDGQVDRQAVEGLRAAPDAIAQADQQAAKASRVRDLSKIREKLLVDGEGDASRPRGAGGSAHWRGHLLARGGPPAR
eukprot:15390132-Heterocapsa_arctica.AAC.1